MKISLSPPIILSWLLGLGVPRLLPTVSGSVAATETDSNVLIHCPPEDITLTIAGTVAGNRLLDAWQQVYSTRHCPGFNVTFETNSWDSGAARVCGSSLLYNPVDMASMSGTFFLPQATTSDGWSFQCHQSKLGRETLLLNVAQKGITLGTKKGGTAASCIELLGGGLSKDQIRWIYSNSSTKELVASGWNPASIPFLDEDDSTHLWSEIHENCTAEEIAVAVENTDNGGAYDYFLEHILTSRGETMRNHFQGNSSQATDEYLEANLAAISFFHLYDMISKAYQARGLLAIGVKSEHGDVIMPSDKAFVSGSYPFLKKVYLGMVNSPEALEFTRPFLEFGLSDEGTQILLKLGYWPILEWEKLKMYSRLGSDHGLEIDAIREQCGPLDGRLAIGGSDTVLPVVDVWSQIYELGCPTDIDINGGGSSVGAYKVCASSESGDAVDVGMMSRDFNWEDEAVPRAKNEFVYDCIVEEDEQSRSVIQIDVALDGISILFPIGGMGEQCVRSLGGLTLDQLRWMYSSYSDTELEQSGWDPESLSNNDFDPNTHKWSELDFRCADEEIQLTGDYLGDGSFAKFSELVLKDHLLGEHIADSRKKPYIQVYGFDAMRYLSEHRDAVSYVGYHYYFEHQEVFWATPVATEAGGSFVTPSLQSIGDGTYPLTRSIFVNIHNNEAALRYAVPVIAFGYSNPTLILSSGYVPIVGDHMEEMIDRLQEGPYLLAGEMENEESSSNKVGIIVGSTFAAVVFVAAVIACIYLCRKW